MVVALLYEMQTPCNCFTLSLCVSDSCRSNSWRDDHDTTMETPQKKDISVTFWAEQIFFCHTYDTSMMIIVTKPGIIIVVVGSYFYDKKS